MSKKRLSFLFALALLISGCIPGSNIHDLLRGEEVTIPMTFPCYFSTGKAKFVSVTNEVVPFILSKPTWKTTQGLIIENTRLNAITGPVSWSDWFTQTIVDGVLIYADVSVRITDDSTTGEKKVYLTLPGITDVASALNANFLCPQQKGFSAPNTFNFTVSESIIVHASEADRTQANNWQVIKFVFIAIGIIIGIIVVVRWLFKKEE